jgi:hypothetical protein
LVAYGLTWTSAILTIYAYNLQSLTRQVLGDTRRFGLWIDRLTQRMLRIFLGGSLMPIPAKVLIEADGTSLSYSGSLVLVITSTEQAPRHLRSESWTGMMTYTPLRNSVVVTIKLPDTST